MIIALSSFEPFPLYKVNLLWDNLTPRSKSTRFFSSHKSQWALNSKSNFLGSPHLYTSTLSASDAPIGVVSSGIFGIWSKISLCFSSNSVCFPSKSFISSPKTRTSSWISSVFSPFFFICPIFWDSAFLFALNSSAFVCIFLLSSSITRTSSIDKAGFLLFKSSLILSGFSLINLISSIFPSFLFPNQYIYSNLNTFIYQVYV